MSLIDDRTRGLWLFEEQHDSLVPSDASGFFDDPEPVAGGAMPAVVETQATGFGRDFASSLKNGISTTDTDDELRLTRNVSVLALVDFDYVAQDLEGKPGTLVQKGDAMSFGVRFHVEDVGNRIVKMTMFWETEALVFVEDDGVLITWPEGDVPLFVTAVREVVDGKLEVRYTVNGDTFTSLSAYDLDVNSASGEELYIGVRNFVSGSGIDGWLSAVVEYLEVVNEAVSPEELLWTWQRLAIDMPNGVAMLRQLVPPDVYSQDPDSFIQRELAVQGVAIGLLNSMTRRLRDYNLPSMAFGEMLEKWEEITGHSPKAGDWIQRRQDRVSAFLAAQQGFAKTSVKAQLEELFNLDSTQIEILEYGVDLSHDFATDPEDYVQEDGAGTWTLGSGVLDFTGTLTDAFMGRALPGDGGFTIWSLGSGVDAWLACKLTLASGSTGQQGLMLGYHNDEDEWLLLTTNDDGTGTTHDILRYHYKNGVLVSDDLLASAIAGSEVHLRMLHTDDGSFELRWGTTASAADAATPATYTATGLVPEWGGFVGASGMCGADFDDLFIHTPNTLNRYNWYAYRDPALPGTYDLPGADLLVRRISQAERYARAIDQQTVLADTAGAGVDLGPIGK